MVSVRVIALALVGLLHNKTFIIINAFYNMLARLVVSNFTVMRRNPVKLLAEDMCGRCLGIRRYAAIYGTQCDCQSLFPKEHALYPDRLCPQNSLLPHVLWESAISGRSDDLGVRVSLGGSGRYRPP